jgi:hypothetical protein
MKKIIFQFYQVNNIEQTKYKIQNTKCKKYKI